LREVDESQEIAFSVIYEGSVDTIRRANRIALKPIFVIY